VYLVGALRYKLEGHGIESLLGQFKIYLILPAALLGLGLTQHLPEMSTRNLHGGGGGWPAYKADRLTAICELTVYKQNVAASTSQNPTSLHGLLRG
jgi:hypothetical protein